MTQENTDDATEEPPDPYPRALAFELNGRGSPARLFRLEDAFYNGRHFVRKPDNQKAVYEQLGEDTYRCVSCNGYTQEARASRDIIRGTIQEPIIQCGPIQYCPKCETLPRNNRLPAINKTDLEKAVKDYEAIEKAGEQQTI
ncbi:MAG: hypothetical protein UR98_C0040G0028 [Parcubacteria group bacterium GW2011_GWA1_36_12]|nr:MAG: hypothetical protein UR98_C0040G0028 [Parcubacteria group bacterium GW2011_GWA1_36_12]